MARRRHEDDVLGKKSLTGFDFCIIGSGAGGGTAAHVLTRAGKKVLVIEAGHNPFPGLDGAHLPPTLHSNDELKYAVRDYVQQQSFLEPRTFRRNTSSPGELADDVNTLPKAVGGAFQHADCATPRFNKVDFELVDAMARARASNPTLQVPGFLDDAGSANFVNWPFRYDDLEPFYAEAELLYGVQGLAGDNVYESDRKGRAYPMPPGVPMYFNLLLKDAAHAYTGLLAEGLHPHTYPKAINSQFRDGRPPCVDCGLCSGFGCPNHSKGSPAVTAVRNALRSGLCQLRFNAAAVRLLHTGRQVTGVEYVDGDGMHQTATAGQYILAASPIESARLCLLSDPGGPGLGNASGQVGQNLMFHLQTQVSAFLPQRVHGQRGRALSHGMSDLRGVQPGGEEIRVLGGQAAMGGICEFSASQGLPITEDGFVYALALGPFAFRSGTRLKNALRDQALGQHLVTITMQAEDAPQRTNFVDLDGRYRDVYGSPVARVTYNNHAYERAARQFYIPHLKGVLGLLGGVENVFAVPCNPVVIGPPSSRHIMGTLRMGDDSATSVTDAGGKFHELDNLYACDGSVFPSSSGYNPTLTIIAVALKIAHGIVGTPPDLG